MHSDLRVSYKSALYHKLLQLRSGISWKDPYTIIIKSDFNSLAKRKHRELIDHAREKVPYYRENASRIDSLTISKATIGENPEAFLASDYEERHYYKNSSGGSTGKPFTFYQDLNFRNWGLATEIYYYRHILGFDPFTEKQICFWGSERDLLNTRKSSNRLAMWLINTEFLNTFKLNEQLIDSYIDKVCRERPYWIKGYAGSLSIIAKRIKERRVKLPKTNFIVSSAESLKASMREEIEEAFNCQVSDYYGSREVGPLAAQCRQGTYHVFPFNNLIEVDAEQSGRPEKAIITNLHNYTMPLIRYEIGDTLRTNHQKCSCSSDLPTIESIEGRVTDHFLTKNGALVHGEFFTHLFYFVDVIEEFQVRQKDFDVIAVYYKTKNGSPLERSEVEKIDSAIYKVMGDDCKILWNLVDEVPPTPQGKRLFTYSEIIGK